jgi:hypothetical protein
MFWRGSTVLATVLLEAIMLLALLATGAAMSLGVWYAVSIPRPGAAAPCEPPSKASPRP